jgi:hypothetical protein
MKTLRVSYRISLAVAFVLMVCTAAKGQTIDFTLTSPSTQNASDGSVVGFDATVTDVNPSVDVYLNGDSGSGAGSLTLDDSPFTGGFPLYLGPPVPPDLTSVTTYTGLLFNVDVPPGTPVGSYDGSFIIQGGADGGASDTLGTVNFTVNVVPEGGASSMYLLLAGGVCFGAMALRSRKKQKAGASA